MAIYENMMISSTGLVESCLYNHNWQFLNSQESMFTETELISYI